MARVEVRTDDGGHSLELDRANLTLKHLLMLRFYADPQFARSFRYDKEDIQRARRNESLAARDGMRAEIENPLTGKPITMQDFLTWTLSELAPLAEVLGENDLLVPLRELSLGGPNMAEQIRAWVYSELGEKAGPETGYVQVPAEVLIQFALEREQRVVKDVEEIAASYPALGQEATKIGQFLQYIREDVHLDPELPLRFHPKTDALVEISYPDKTTEIIALAETLVQIPSVTACPEERLEEVRRIATFIYDYLSNLGMHVRLYNQEKYPALLASFPSQLESPVMLCGHFDVVEPEPDDSQFVPRIDGDYLWGRGAADMKTVVATYMVWMKDILRKGPPYPKVNLLLVGNEENGETEKMGTPHVLEILEKEGNAPEIVIAGERTGEHGNEVWGEICTQNRGVMRFEVIAHGQRGHSGSSSPAADLTDRLLDARSGISKISESCLTLKSQDGWQTQARFPFIQVGVPGVFNITPAEGRLGVEVRPIPQDDLALLRRSLETYCANQELELCVFVQENGIICSPDNLYLTSLIQAVYQVSGNYPRIGKKLPGTSARFAPGGQGVVWGQSGLGPHARDERHYIPSILPYYKALDEYGRILSRMELTK
jgi:succinyl-diaminopimelate desuccinylase